MKEETKRLRILCDTNVLLSMLGLPGRRLQALWEVIQEGKADLFVSDFILEELRRNLGRKIGLSQREVDGILEAVKRRAGVVMPDQKVNLIQEKKSDNHILESALAARVDVLITGNFKHIRPLGTFRGITILTPREFLDRHFPLR